MLPSTVRDAIQLLYQEIETHMPDVIQSIYVYGSIALNAYMDGVSDVDYIAVTKRPMQKVDGEALESVHSIVRSVFPTLDIMGTYIIQSQLGQPFSKNNSGYLFTYYDNQLHSDGTGLDLNPVTWWVLRRHGVCVVGESIHFTYQVTEEQLKSYVVGNMNSYWVNYRYELIQKQLVWSQTEMSSREMLLLTNQLDEAIEWSVLGMLRQWYTILEGEVTSKLAAGQYGLMYMPLEHRKLIQQAIALRHRQYANEYRDKSALLDNVTYLIQLLHHVHVETNSAYNEWLEQKSNNDVNTL